MNRHNTSRFALAAAIAVLTLTASTVGNAAPSARWHAVLTAPAKLQGGVLASVVSFGPTDALAGGYRFIDQESGDIAPIIRHWNGHSWTVWSHQLVVNPVTDPYGITDLAATSDSNVWTMDNNSDYSTRIRHWDGHRWSIVTARGLNPTFLGSLLVTSTHVWIVGNNDNSGAAFIATYHAHGARSFWTSIRAARTGGFNAASARGNGDAWAVGSTATYPVGTGEPLIEHWNGHRWRRSPAPRINADLLSVAATSTDSALAVGYTGVNPKHALDVDLNPDATPVALHWNGKTWKHTAVPSAHATLNTVVGTAAGTYWAAGIDPAHPIRSVYFHDTHGTWSTHIGPTRTIGHGTTKGQFVSIDALALNRGTEAIWAVGFDAPNDCGDIDDCAGGQAGNLIIDRDN